MKLSTLCSPSSPEKDSPSSVTEGASRPKSATSPWSVGSLCMGRRRPVCTWNVPSCWPLCAFLRRPKDPEKATSQQGPSQTFCRPFVFTLLISSLSSLNSSPSVQTSRSLSQSGLFGQPYFHMSPKSGDILHRLSQRHFRQHHLGSPSHSLVEAASPSLCSRHSHAFAKAAVGLSRWTSHKLQRIWFLV